MTALPVIAGFGGVNAAGRTSFHHGYKRLVESALSDAVMAPTWESLAQMMNQSTANGLTPELIESLRRGTLIRRIEPALFDINAVRYQHQTELEPGPDGLTFRARRSQLPSVMPDNWEVLDSDRREITVRVTGQTTALFPEDQTYPVSSAGQVPSGFDASRLYRSAHHPRGITHAIYGASDAIHSLGLPWEDLLGRIQPDQVSVYAGSALGQVDGYGFEGLYQNSLKGGRTSSKMMALSLSEMAADFINGYMINSVGSTGTNIGACATFLYNLRQGIMDIQAGKARLVIVGNTEAPIVPSILEGFNVMGALASDENLRRLDDSDTVDSRRACRPFSTNAGFTMAESAQFLVLMDDRLALETGAHIHGSVPDVFVNADANKKSISAPGVGNYITVAKAAALARSMLGRHGLAETFVQAHGTGTPQNRVTESHILNEVARQHGISDWAVSAVKAYVGHSLGPAAGDQLMASLGVWSYGIVPGIKTIDHIADDVHRDSLNILMDHLPLGEPTDMRASLINSKGFGGNNASALMLSPAETRNLMERRHGKQAMTQWEKTHESVAETAKAYDQTARRDGTPIIYRFAEAVMDGSDVRLGEREMHLSRFERSIPLTGSHPYDDMLD